MRDTHFYKQVLNHMDQTHDLKPLKTSKETQHSHKKHSLDIDRCVHTFPMVSNRVTLKEAAVRIT